MVTAGGAVGAAMVLCLAAGATAAPSAAASNAAVQSEALIQKGLAHRKAGNDDAALPEFRAAYELAPTPRSAAQLGLCEQALGQWALADDHLSESLEARHDAWIGKNRVALETALAAIKARVARIEIVVEPPGAEVSVNGRLVGQAPLGKAIKVNAGAVDVSARAAGHEPATQSVKLVGGEYQHVVLRLSRSAVAQNSPAAPSLAARDPGAGDAVVNAASQSEEGSARSLAWVRPAAWGATGMAVVALGFGAFEQLRSASRYREFNARKAGGSELEQCTRFLADKGGPECAGLLDDGKNAQTLAVVGFVGAGVFGAAAAVLHYLGGRGEQAGSASAMACTPTAGGGVCGWTF